MVLGQQKAGGADHWRLRLEAPGKGDGLGVLLAAACRRWVPADMKYLRYGESMMPTCRDRFAQGSVVYQASARSLILDAAQLIGHC